MVRGVIASEGMRRNFGGTAAALAALACWSIGPIFIKLLTRHFDAWTQNFYRYLVACLFLLPVLLTARAKGQIARGVWLRALAPAAFNVVMQTFWAFSYYYLNPAFMNLMSQSSVLWITLFSFIIFAEERALLARATFWMGLIFSLSGLAGVILSGRNFRVEGTTIGVLLTLSSSLTWALYVISARIAFRRTPSEQGFAVICLYTVAGLFATALIFSHPFRNLPAEPGPWLYVLISAIVPIALAHVSYYASMKRIGSTVPALILLALPFLVLPQSILVFHEPFIPAQWLWGLVLIAGCVCSILSQRKPASVTPNGRADAR